MHFLFLVLPLLPCILAQSREFCLNFYLNCNHLVEFVAKFVCVCVCPECMARHSTIYKTTNFEVHFSCNARAQEMDRVRLCDIKHDGFFDWKTMRFRVKQLRRASARTPQIILYFFFMLFSPFIRQVPSDRISMIMVTIICTTIYHSENPFRSTRKGHKYTHTHSRAESNETFAVT